LINHIYKNSYFRIKNEILITRISSIFTDENIGIIDVGCNKGISGCKLSLLDRISNNYNFNYIGVDLDKNSLEDTKNYTSPYKKVTAVHADICDFSYSDEKFDIVIFSDSLEHIENPRKALINIKKLMKENGKLMIVCPSMFRLDLFKGQKYKNIMTSFKNISSYEIGSTHINYWSEEELSLLIKESGFIINRRKPIYLLWGVIFLFWLIPRYANGGSKYAMTLKLAFGFSRLLYWNSDCLYPNKIEDNLLKSSFYSQSAVKYIDNEIFNSLQPNLNIFEFLIKSIMLNENNKLQKKHLLSIVGHIRSDLLPDEVDLINEYFHSVIKHNKINLGNSIYYEASLKKI